MPTAQHLSSPPPPPSPPPFPCRHLHSPCHNAFDSPLFPSLHILASFNFYPISPPSPPPPPPPLPSGSTQQVSPAPSPSCCACTSSSCPSWVSQPGNHGMSESERCACRGARQLCPDDGGAALRCLSGLPPLLAPLPISLTWEPVGVCRNVRMHARVNVPFHGHLSQAVSNPALYSVPPSLLSPSLLPPGVDGWAAPRLKDVPMTDARASECYMQVRQGARSKGGGREGKGRRWDPGRKGGEE